MLPLAEEVWLPVLLDLVEPFPPALALDPVVLPAPLVLLVPVFRLSLLPEPDMPLAPPPSPPELPPPETLLDQPLGLLPPVPAPMPALELGLRLLVSSRLSWLVEPWEKLLPPELPWSLSDCLPQLIADRLLLPPLLRREKKKAPAAAAAVATAAAA